MSSEKQIKAVDIAKLGPRVSMETLGDGGAFAYAVDDGLADFVLQAPLYLNRPAFANVFPGGAVRRHQPAVCMARGCFLFGPAGFVVLPDGSLIRQSVVRFDAASLSYSLDRFKNQFPGRNLMWTAAEEPLFSVNGYGTNNYFHFLADAVGQLHWRERIPAAEKARMIVSGYTPAVEEALKYVRPIQDAVGIKAAELYPFDGTILFCHQILFPCRDTGATPARVAFIRERLGLKDAPRGKARLYVARGEAARRKVLNEGKVESLLKGHGFVSVNPGVLSFMEQVKLFADAAVVVGPHGAGLTNAMFMAPGGALVELTHTGRVVWTYHEVACAAGLSYACVVGERVDAEPGGAPLFADMTVDLDGLDAAVKAALAAV